MKTLERIIKGFILTETENHLDPLQFAYRIGKGVEDAKIFILDKLYTHLERPGTHAKILFADFSSAFNLMKPHILVQKMINDFNVDGQIIAWVIDFLTNRPQHVRVNGSISNSKLTQTGSPQGCCLSPLLYILYTDSCRSAHEDRYLVKFADDSALLSLLSDRGGDHGPALNDFVEWCDDSFLELNVAKTKELVIDFRKTQSFETVKTTIHDQEVETVTRYKYLGTIFDDKLSFNFNTDEIVKKCRQRMYFLRKLNSFSVDKVILTLFYKSFIESVLCFSFICWYYNLGVKNKNNLQKIVRTCSKVIGEPQRSISQFFEQQTLRKAHTIVLDRKHALNELFEILPSGRRYRTPKCRTNRRRLSFIPVAIRLLNNGADICD